MGVDTSNPQRYAAGALLLNGARLEEIYSDHVVLLRDGKYFKLFVADGNAKSPKGNVELAMMGGQMFAEVRPQPREQPKLTDTILFMPFYENERLSGIQVLPGRHKGEFSQLGLRTRDVIVAMNGVPVADEQTALATLETLTAGSTLEVSIRRDSGIHSLSIDGGVLTAAFEARRQQAEMAALAASGPN